MNDPVKTVGAKQVQTFALVDLQGRLLTPGSVLDSTGIYSFDLASLAKAYTYDANSDVATITYGPDHDGRSVRITRTWANRLMQAESAPVLVGIAATSLTLSGASTAVVGNPSGDITVTVAPADSYFSPFTFTPTDGRAGGKFTPSTVELSYRSRSAKFTYTPASVGVATVSGTVDVGDLAVVAPLALTAYAPGKADAPVQVNAVAGANSVTISWEPVAGSGTGGAAVRDYMVTLSDGHSKLVPAAQSSWTFQNLVPNVVVTGTVAAVTGAGLGTAATSNAVMPYNGNDSAPIPMAVSGVAVGTSAI